MGSGEAVLSRGEYFDQAPAPWFERGTSGLRVLDPFTARLEAVSNPIPVTLVP